MPRLCRACRYVCVGTSLVVWALTILVFSGCFGSFFDTLDEAASQAVNPLLPGACGNQSKTLLLTEERRKRLTCLFLMYEGEELPPHYFSKFSHVRALVDKMKS